MKDNRQRLIRLEYYHDEDATKPICYRRFSERMVNIREESWKTIVLDSVTSMELAKRHEAQYKTLKGARDPRQWYAASKEGLEEMLMTRFGSLPSIGMNVVVLAHISDEQTDVEGHAIYNPMAPGKLAKGLPSGYAETYHAYAIPKKEGNLYRLQTEADHEYKACTQIPAPSLCKPLYKELWANCEEDPYPTLFLVYGNAGSKKSTFAATFPKPMLVLSFDNRGKERPYLRKGEPGKVKWSNRLGIFVQDVYKPQKEGR